MLMLILYVQPLVEVKTVPRLTITLQSKIVSAQCEESLISHPYSSVFSTFEQHDLV